MEKYYDSEINDREISYLPYGHQRFKATLLIFGSLAVLAGIVLLYLGIISVWFSGVVILVGGVLFLRGFYERFVQSRIRLTFNKQDRLLYKKTVIRRYALMRFDEIGGIITTSEQNVFWYCLTRKSNRFGKGVSISGSFKNDGSEERDVFENTILTAIDELLKMN